jgi:hypothetical protein
MLRNIEKMIKSVIFEFGSSSRVSGPGGGFSGGHVCPAKPRSIDDPARDPARVGIALLELLHMREVYWPWQSGL